MTHHRTPWGDPKAKVPAFDDDLWELFSDKDWSQADNLAKEMPERLHELRRQFMVKPKDAIRAALGRQSAGVQT